MTEAGNDRTASSQIARGALWAIRRSGALLGYPLMTRRLVGGASALMLAAFGTAHGQDNNYPTSTRVDYVIGCMAANGNTREALLKCSCAIDTIAGLMPYAHYERAETALSLQAGGGVGGRVSLFRDPPQIKAVIQELRRAQAEANLQCR